ncbi:hypothetical protein SS50377_25856 [Spironucleus salmonicida]|uniref:Uncharacterized protein n=1 Tax=Spironucleus salmonicida TaxID=348837 RepID=V6LXT1_9EUKA|nr:hypothetical protein SS50377_25842 [Spironucleus salmonicida]KAH0571666.1 hypothetical protein SS50377_25856 [Spironucleus salmonicida]|eukprot:EST49058.1 Hypothetical protein SS50377_10681 [Spironucleus salmonicida]
MDMESIIELTLTGTTTTQNPDILLLSVQPFAHIDFIRLSNYIALAQQQRQNRAVDFHFVPDLKIRSMLVNSTIESYQTLYSTLDTLFHNQISGVIFPTRNAQRLVQQFTKFPVLGNYENLVGAIKQNLNIINEKKLLCHAEFAIKIVVICVAQPFIRKLIHASSASQQIISWLIQNDVKVLQ